MLSLSLLYSSVLYQFPVPNSREKRACLGLPFMWRWQQRGSRAAQQNLTVLPVLNGRRGSLCKKQTLPLHVFHSLLLHCFIAHNHCMLHTWVLSQWVLNYFIFGKFFPVRHIYSHQLLTKFSQKHGSTCWCKDTIYPLCTVCDIYNMVETYFKFKLQYIKYGDRISWGGLSDNFLNNRKMGRRTHSVHCHFRH